ncbi:hypothetical protein [Botryobacter ruber]|uniref:hypothetical protein n=1 Tax=Botryobacter ruber TaxID=2171629 RepID=UPI0013E37EFE|nr:hypothetical protein [Botryobacter ruber]
MHDNYKCQLQTGLMKYHQLPLRSNWRYKSKNLLFRTSSVRKPLCCGRPRPRG